MKHDEFVHFDADQSSTWLSAMNGNTKFKLKPKFEKKTPQVHEDHRREIIRIKQKKKPNH